MHSHASVPCEDDLEPFYRLLEILLFCLALYDQPPNSPLGQVIQVMLIVLHMRQLTKRTAA
jgi:hypothetical protein